MTPADGQDLRDKERQRSQLQPTLLNQTKEKDRNYAQKINKKETLPEEELEFPLFFFPIALTTTDLYLQESKQDFLISRAIAEFFKFHKMGFSRIEFLRR